MTGAGERRRGDGRWLRDAGDGAVSGRTAGSTRKQAGVEEAPVRSSCGEGEDEVAASVVSALDPDPVGGRGGDILESEGVSVGCEGEWGIRARRGGPAESVVA